MWFIVIPLVVVGQFDRGQEVYVKVPLAKAWQTSGLAAERFEPSAPSGSLESARNDLFAGRRPLRTAFRKGEKFAVIETIEADGEKLVKVRPAAGEPWWIYADDLSPLDDSARQEMDRDAIRQRLVRHCITRPDHEALNAALAKGLDPLTMTAAQAESLTRSQRKALSGVKARYLRATR